MKTPRKHISARTRFEIFKRDGFKCQYCGKSSPNVILEVDHILPVKEGGTNELMNLVCACEECNGGKAAVLLSKKPESLKTAQKKERERLAQITKYNEWLAEIRIKKQAWLDAVSRHWIALDGCDPQKFRIAGEREQAVKMFLDRLPAEQIINALEITYSRPFLTSERSILKYFCSVCWHKIRGESYGGQNAN
jgi:hypothetical protein